MKIRTDTECKYCTQSRRVMEVKGNERYFM